jgi:hypothetical protein
MNIEIDRLFAEMKLLETHKQNLTIDQYRQKLAEIIDSWNELYNNNNECQQETNFDIANLVCLLSTV